MTLHPLEHSVPTALFFEGPLHGRIVAFALKMLTSSAMCFVAHPLLKHIRHLPKYTNNHSVHIVMVDRYVCFIQA